MAKLRRELCFLLQTGLFALNRVGGAASWLSGFQPFPKPGGGTVPRGAFPHSGLHLPLLLGLDLPGLASRVTAIRDHCEKQIRVSLIPSMLPAHGTNLLVDSRTSPGAPPTDSGSSLIDASHAAPSSKAVQDKSRHCHLSSKS